MSDLLDLVRTTEDEARVALRKRTPAVPIAVGAGGAEEVIEVGEDAVDLPPSYPPMRVATPAGTFPKVRVVAPAPSVPTRARGGMPPVLAILLVFALPIVALAFFAR